MSFTVPAHSSVDIGIPESKCMLDPYTLSGNLPNSIDIIDEKFSNRLLFPIRHKLRHETLMPAHDALMARRLLEHTS